MSVFRRSQSAPPEFVVEPNDIVFAEIGTGLHLRLVRARSCPDWSGGGCRRCGNVRRFRSRERVVTLSPTCTSAVPLYDNPVLGAMVMLLQRQPFAGFDEDALDLEALAGNQRGIAAPRDDSQVRWCFSVSAEVPVRPPAALLTMVPTFWAEDSLPDERPHPR